MHLICLGVTRRILHCLRKVLPCCRLSFLQISRISEVLISFRQNIPSNFSRKLRSFFEMDRWKATEFRQFLLYTGMVALKGILSAEMCTHFLSFSLGVSMLLSSIDEERNCGISWARELLSYLVTEAAEFYGITFNVYNIHSVIHIADGVENRNCTLDDLSCFRFENFLHCLKTKS